MKTQIPEKFSTVEEIEKFYKELYKNGEFYHLDDDATDIIQSKNNEPLFTVEEANKLNKLNEQARSLVPRS
jgi:hypothetical protein